MVNHFDGRISDDSAFDINLTRHYRSPMFMVLDLSRSEATVRDGARTLKKLTVFTRYPS